MDKKTYFSIREMPPRFATISPPAPVTPYSLDYIIEKFYQAVWELAVGEGDARSRLDLAYHRLWHIQIEEFPAELRADRKRIDVLLTRLPAKQGYIIPDNLRSMKNRTAAKIAAIIVGLYFRLIAFRSDTTAA